MPDWKYLYSEVFQVRYAIAAHYLRGCRNVIEIGGYKTPIDGFLTHRYDSVLVVDPLVEPFQGKKVRRVACDYRTFDFSPYSGANYGLALLGLDLPLSAALFDLAAGAKTVVVEFSEDGCWKAGREGFQTLVGETGLRLRQRIQLDLSGNDFGDLTDSWPPRTNRFIYVLSPGDGGG
ncbi:MAG: hypothetical protein ACKV2U_25875 [Bryobacteraceae bacterium]